MQIDALIFFVEGWDSDIVNQHNSMQNDLGVMTTYLTDVQGSIPPSGSSLRKTIRLCETLTSRSLFKAPT